MHLPASIIRPPIHIAREETSDSQSTSTLFLTTTGNHTSSGNALNGSVPSTHLVWWQLVALSGGGFILVLVGGWWYWRHRRRVGEDRKRKLEVERAERERELEKRHRIEEAMAIEANHRAMATRKRRIRRAEYDSEDDETSEESDESEDYDSVSDGGTIRPRRRKRRKRRYRDRDRDRDRYRRRRGRRRRGSRYSDSESELSDDSDESEDQSARKTITSKRSISPPPPIPDIPPDGKRKSNFRDSVFSTYHSMKRAAVKLKYVEAKVKLKKQLEEEERIDKERKAKIEQANRELDITKGSGTRGHESANSNQPLIPPVAAPLLTGSSGTLTGLPRPPSRTARKGSFPPPDPSFHRLKSRQPSADSYFPSKQEPSVNQIARQGELGNEISELLGSRKREHHQDLHIPPVPIQKSEDFQASWLSKPFHSHPNSNPSVPQSPTSSVYIPVTHPKNRPVIPIGSLAPAPPPKAKQSVSSNPTKGVTNADRWQNFGEHKAEQSTGVENSMAGIGAGGSSGGAKKWADRMRQRRFQ